MKNLFILLPGPYLERDYFRFGINLFKKDFFVKAVDCTAWIYRNYWETYSKNVYKSEDYIIISCKEDFLNFTSQIGIGNTVIIDCLPHNKKTNWMRKLLRKKNCLFVVAYLGSIPLPKRNIMKILYKIILKPKKFASKLFRFLHDKYYISKRNIPDISVLGGLASLNMSKAKNKIYAHSMDYDVYLNIKNKQTDSNIPYAVFVDQNIVNHSDYIFFNLKPPISENEYYPLLVKFLKKFTMETKLQVLFAVHPKSNILKLPNLLKGIKYTAGNTAELIKNSNMVLLHSSTSISFAVLFNKPAVFLTSNKLKNSWIGPSIDNFAKTLNSRVINMNNDLNECINLQNLSKFDEGKYKNYLDQYLKVPNSPNAPLWEIVIDYIKHKQL